MKGEVKEMDWSSPFPEALVGPDVTCLKVRAGTKIQNIVTFAHKLFEVRIFLLFMHDVCSRKTVSVWDYE